MGGVLDRWLTDDADGLPAADLHRRALENALGPKGFVDAPELQQDVARRRDVAARRFSGRHHLGHHLRHHSRRSGDAALLLLPQDRAVFRPFRAAAA